MTQRRLLGFSAAAVAVGEKADEGEGSEQQRRRLGDDPRDGAGVYPRANQKNRLGRAAVVNPDGVGDEKLIQERFIRHGQCVPICGRTVRKVELRQVRARQVAKRLLSVIYKSIVVLI